MLFDGTKDFLRYVRGKRREIPVSDQQLLRSTDAYIAKMARLRHRGLPDDFLTSARTRRSATRQGRYLPDTVNIYVCAAPNRSKTSSGSQGFMWRSSFGMRSASRCSADDTEPDVRKARDLLHPA
ncbi:MAG: hypothetical protein ACLU3I_04425 [Acutalibacteraceae bacterium]